MVIYMIPKFLIFYYRRHFLNSSTHVLFSDFHVLCVEPSGVQALKNPNPLKDVETSTVLDVAVLV